MCLSELGPAYFNDLLGAMVIVPVQTGLTAVALWLHRKAVDGLTLLVTVPGWWACGVLLLDP